ncbi:Protein transport protein yip1 like [Verticillium longisporum]|uniref:Protein transport protein yip1 like n=2 Tax=Verticillium longisporum TaxID=100787 RepID=A0A8I2ZFV0_VERLO|nr:Protein transport protein yip1 like [Verticillium longisporum]
MTPTELGPHEADSHTHPSAAQYPGGPGGSGVGVVPGGATGGGSGGGSGGKPGHFSTTLTFARSSSILGYCLLPLVATSLLGILMPMDTPLGIVITSAAILWCTYAASGMFVAIGRMMSMRLLIAYPLALFYVGFGIMGVFSSRGSTLAAAAAGLKP